MPNKVFNLHYAGQDLLLHVFYTESGMTLRFLDNHPQRLPFRQFHINPDTYTGQPVFGSEEAGFEADTARGIYAALLSQHHEFEYIMGPAAMA
jgi:hypothetical protein